LLTAAVEAVRLLTPHMARIGLRGDDLRTMSVPQPAGSVRLLMPFPGTAELPSLVWNGNAYRLDDGSRPLIRTFTPLHFDPAVGRLDLDVVLHATGATTAWIESAASGDPVAVSGPGRGYTIDAAAAAYLLAGDETALPAIRQIVAGLAARVKVRAVVEIGDPQARQELPDHPGLEVRWALRQPGAEPGAALLPAIRSGVIDAAGTAWAAGEAGAMFHVRQYLLDEAGLDRRRVTVRGYWKDREG
jgi:NADPH-dependent ferric siderophore reductase